MLEGTAQALMLEHSLKVHGRRERSLGLSPLLWEAFIKSLLFTLDQRLLAGACVFSPFTLFCLVCCLLTANAEGEAARPWLLSPKGALRPLQEHRWYLLPRRFAAVACSVWGSGVFLRLRWPFVAS